MHPTVVDWSWIVWQGVVPLTAPLLVWLGVCAAKSALATTPKLTEYLQTAEGAVEEHGWLTYTVFLSLQSSVAINAARAHSTMLFAANIVVLLSSVAILAAAFVSRFHEEDGVVAMRPASAAPVLLQPVGILAVIAAVIGYFTMSAGSVL